MPHEDPRGAGPHLELHEQLPRRHLRQLRRAGERQRVLACETQLDALLDTYQTTTLYLEPLNHFPVVRDLVVDFAPVEKGMRKVDAWLCPSKERRDHLQSEADFTR